jgi:hypothetical protein
VTRVASTSCSAGDVTTGDSDVSDGFLISTGPAVLLAVINAQFDYSARAGNQAYGGMISFYENLTDTGLQEYRRATWW